MFQKRKVQFKAGMSGAANEKQALHPALTAPSAPSHAPIRKKAPNILGRMFVKKKHPFTRRSHQLDTALIIHHLRSEAYHPPFSALAAGIASRVRIRLCILRRKRGVCISLAQTGTSAPFDWMRATGKQPLRSTPIGISAPENRRAASRSGKDLNRPPRRALGWGNAHSSDARA